MLFISKRLRGPYALKVTVDTDKGRKSFHIDCVKPDLDFAARTERINRSFSECINLKCKIIGLVLINIESGTYKVIL